MLDTENTTTETATAVRVTDSLRELLKLLNFPEIPEEATYIASFEDGTITYIENEIETKSEDGGFTLPALPQFMFISTSYHTDVYVVE